MKPQILRLIKGSACGAVGGILAILGGGIWLLNNKPELSIWHTAALDEEFTRRSEITSFEDYLELENRLFTQLETEVYDKVEEKDKIWINRYSGDGETNPGRWDKNWNRSFELKQAQPVAGILMIHGLTDSPYSMRHVAKTLHGKGAYVLALRVPGHGTAPSSLAEVKWQDMEAAVEVAARHVAKQAPGVPFYLVGYSNGGALSVRYAINTIKDDKLPKVDSMVLLSPEIGVGKVAGLAIWQERIGRVLGLKKLGWTGLMLEYDPFKYSSFPVNGGILAHDLTKANRKDMARLAKSEELGEFPETIAFQSALDSTVSAPDLVREFFFHLPEGGHELVVYDLNRTSGIEPVLANDPKAKIDPIIHSEHRDFEVTVVTNQSLEKEEVVALTWPSGEKKSTKHPIGLSWPRGLYSLSHVALPFPGDDPLYGGSDTGGSQGGFIGSIAPKGEKGALKIPAGDILRLRWNPFFLYQEERILEHLGMASD